MATAQTLSIRLPGNKLYLLLSMFFIIHLFSVPDLNHTGSVFVICFPICLTSCHYLNLICLYTNHFLYFEYLFWLPAGLIHWLFTAHVFTCYLGYPFASLWITSLPAACTLLFVCFSGYYSAKAHSYHSEQTSVSSWTTGTLGYTVALPLVLTGQSI